MAHLAVGVLLVAVCNVAMAQSNSTDGALLAPGGVWSPIGNGFGGSGTSMMVIIGLGLMSATLAVLVIVGIMGRLRRRAQGGEAADGTSANQDAGASAAEEGRLPRPVPFLVMQPNGKDVACAYVVNGDDTDKFKAPDAVPPAARGAAGAARAPYRGGMPTYYASSY